MNGGVTDHITLPSISRPPTVMTYLTKSPILNSCVTLASLRLIEISSVRLDASMSAKRPAASAPAVKRNGGVSVLANVRKAWANLLRSLVCLPSTALVAAASRRKWHHRRR